MREIREIDENAKKSKRAYIYIEIRGHFLELEIPSTYDLDFRHRPISQQFKTLHKISARSIKKKKSYTRSKLKFSKNPQIRYFSKLIHFCQDVFLFTRALHTYSTHRKRKVFVLRNQLLWLEGRPSTLADVTVVQSSDGPRKLCNSPAKKMHFCQEVFLFTHPLHTYSAYRKRKFFVLQNQPLWIEGRPSTLADVTDVQSSDALRKSCNSPAKKNVLLSRRFTLHSRTSHT